MFLKKPLYPCLWFNNQAEEAAAYYCSIFPDSELLESNPMVTTFKVNGNKFMALNGGPHYQFTPAISFVIECETQDQIDHFWENLGTDGKYSKCGWLEDKFGVSWQIIPSILGELMTDPSRGKRVQELFLQMTKFEIEPLLNA